MNIFTNRFPEIILDPIGAPHLTPKEHTHALVTSIALGILTIGILQAVCALVLLYRKIIANPSNFGPSDNTNRIFQNIHPNDPLYHKYKQIGGIATSGCVAFYLQGPTEFLGNFSHSPISIWGKTFLCAEAAFHWKKYELASHNSPQMAADPMMNDFFLATGEKAFSLNRKFETKYPGVFANGWKNGVRDEVMWEVQQAKYQQNPSHQKLLHATEKAYLLEHNQKARDNYWSDNEDGSGKNMLGQMLMALRDNQGKPPVNNTDPRMGWNTQAIRKQIANGSLGYKIF